MPSRRYGPSAVDDVGDGGLRLPDRLCEPVLGDAKRLQELFEQNLARTGYVIMNGSHRTQLLAPRHEPT